MQLEEIRDFQMNAQAANRGDKGKEKDRAIRHILGHSDKFRDDRGPRIHTYTPLNVDKGKIMDGASHADLIPTLKKLQSLRDVDMSKQWQYHCNFRHTTKEC